jgi:hypothetical protein
VPAERETGPDGAETRNSEVTDRDSRWERLGVLFDRALVYVTPPAVLTEPPASVAELATYARAGAWTGRRSGLVRGAGVWWYRLVGLPCTVVCRYAEWIFQRPGRAIPVLLLVKLLASTTWGSWSVAHLVTPALHAALWLFL